MNIYKGVVTYMCCVEAFMTGIKIESSDQSTFLRVDQGIMGISELRKSRIKNVWL